MLSLEKEKPAERETALHENEEKLLKGKKQLQDVKQKLKTYREKLVHVSKKLMEEKQILLAKREKLVEAGKKTGGGR